MRLQIDIGKKYPRITGPLSDTFADELNALLDSRDLTELVLDFKGTQVVSSMAIGAIFSAYQRLREQGKSMRIINASPKVTHLMRMVNMANILI